MKFIDKSKSTLKNIFSYAVHGESAANFARKPAAIDAVVALAAPLAGLGDSRDDYEVRLRDVLAATRTTTLDKISAAGIIVALEPKLREVEGAYNGRVIDAAYYAANANDTGKPVLALFDNGLTRREAGIWGGSTAEYAVRALERFGDFAGAPIKAEKLIAQRRIYAASRPSGVTITEWHQLAKKPVQAAPKP